MTYENHNNYTNKNLITIPVNVTPLSTIFDRSIKVSEFLNLGELYDATKILDKTDLFSTGITFDKRLLEIHTYIRKALNNALYVGSLGRSLEWEHYKNRDGTSQHVNLIAIDLNGMGLVDLIQNAVKTQNQIYTDLRRMGVNSFGLYDWGVHLDLRPAQSDGNIYFWDYQKKKLKQH
ncbi:MAG: hypothetical protein ACJA1D_000170 [Polaribacter sp.]|jgi:hypothetical protein